MSFSATTCLTYTGTTSLGPTLYVYSNVDGYYSYFSTVPTSAITSNNCPYIITGITDTTTTIRLYDPVSNCCVYIPLQSNDLCVTCDLNFTLLSATTVSQIVAGNLTGSCASLTDYVVYWYGPNSTTNVGYISGYGNEFDYQFTHPLTGTSAIFAQAGTYVPIVDKVIISGLTFSQTGGTGLYGANLNCFPVIEVDPLTCSNGTLNVNSLPYYTHKVQFSGATSGVSPVPLSSTFELDPTTKYFAWRFYGASVEDTLKITFVGSSYPVPIVLENLTVGSNLPFNDFTPTKFPKSADTAGYVQKVTTLTALTVNTGDYLILEVTPNTGNTQTNWELYFRCMNTFDCTICADSGVPYKISGSSITVTPGSCNTVLINFYVSGCPSSYENSLDVTKYLMSSAYANTLSFGTNGLRLYSTGNLYYNSVICSQTTLSSCGTPPCSTSSYSGITYEKTVSGGVGLITMTFTGYSDFTHYYNSYQTFNQSYSGNPTNPLSVDYYRYYELIIPLITDNSICGDGTPFRTYTIHPSAVVTTGDTGGSYPYTMSITMPTITNQIPYTSCDLFCSAYTNTIVNNINIASTGTSNNYIGTTLTGAKYSTPFFCGGKLTQITNTNSGQTYQISSLLYKYMNETYASSGVTNTLIPSLSATTCNFKDRSHTYGNPNNLEFYSQFVGYYVLQLTNPSNLSDFIIYASPIINGDWSGATGPGTSPVLTIPVYGYSGGSVYLSNPTYII